MAKKEHSINEVYGLLSEFTGFVKGQFESTENQFKKIEGQFQKQGQILALHTLQLEHIGTDIRDVKKSQNEIEKEIKAIKEDVYAVGKSIYKQHQTLEKHARRLVNLES